MSVQALDKFDFKNKKFAVIKMVILSSTLFLTACQPKGDNQSVTDKKEAASSAKVQSDQLFVLSKTVSLPVQQAQSCDEEGCIQYEFQTVETNHPWINEYFIDRIKTANPVAFQAPSTGEKPKVIAEKDLGEASIVVRFIGQNQNLATFEMMSYIYSAGAAHGMYHNEYVNFDLKTQKRISLQDLVVTGADSKVVEALFSTNSMWLEDHSIEQTKLKLSDNFYYGANGIVFVYPLYELASYAEGMSELTLPYHYTANLIKPEFLPNLPKYKNQ